MSPPIFLPRRTFLRGVGASIGLPLLDAMTPAADGRTCRSSPNRPPTRLGFVYFPMGYAAADWTPHDVGRLDLLPPALRSLAPVQRRVTIFSHLALTAESLNPHAAASGRFLSFADEETANEETEVLGIGDRAMTIDQVAARRIGGATPLASLELSIDLSSTVSHCAAGGDAETGSLSWSSPNAPVIPECRPRGAFERLFGARDVAAARLSKRPMQLSVLDVVADDRVRLMRALGVDDRRRIEEFVEAVREVERRIEHAEALAAKGVVIDLDRPREAPDSYVEHVRLMFDLQRLAFQSDATRVIAFQLARERSNRTYEEVGVFQPHHLVTHLGDQQARDSQLAAINRLQVALFAEFLQKLQATSEGDGTLLDRAIFLFGSGMSDPYRHTNADLPILVAGGSADAMDGPYHVRCPQATPLSRLLTRLLRLAALPSNGPGATGGDPPWISADWKLDRSSYSS